MEKATSLWAFAWLLLAMPGTAARGETVILQLHILEGENGVFAASGRAVRPVSVRVTDETGAPVGGVAVSFRLPEDGVTGVFQNGLKTDMALSGPDGKAVAPNVVWGPLVGQARIRVTAALEQARAGVLIPVYVAASDNIVVAGASSSAAAAPIVATDRNASPQPQLRRSHRTRWLLALAGGLGAGVAISLVKKPVPGSGTAGATASPSLSIGQPSISIGR